MGTCNIPIPQIGESFTLPIMPRFFGGPGYDWKRVQAYQEAVKIVVDETTFWVNGRRTDSRLFDAPPVSFRLIKFEVEDGGPMVNKYEMNHWMCKKGLKLVPANYSELAGFGATFPGFSGPQIHGLGSKQADEAGWWHSNGYRFPVLSFRDRSPKIAFQTPPSQSQDLMGNYRYGWSNNDLFLFAEESPIPRRNSYRLRKQERQ